MQPAVICVPARDERSEIPSLIRTVAAQEADAPIRLVLLANHCRDGTAERARELAAAEPRLQLRLLEVEFPSHEAHAGSARRAAVQAGADWLCELGAHETGVVLSTDADARLPPGWLIANLRALASGAEVVGGRIEAEDTSSNPLPAAIRGMASHIGAYWQAVRALSDSIDPLPHDPPPRHGDHTGASLAVALPWLRAVGGVPPLRSREDVALVEALEWAGARLRHAPDVWVEVSARQHGRAEGGMAAEMRRWATAPADAYHLPAASHWLRLARTRRAIRDGFHSGRLPDLAGYLGLEAASLTRIAAESPNDIACVARVCRLLPTGTAAQQEMVAAMREMRALAEPERVA
ncbi:glycosyltransferase [Pseudoroseomonas globiformis]|uniref:Glycosyltransferase n=1 Tax=Teichococcus globiformis TaxID=2307229 RepID=A0ABV7FTU5_9PROT